MKTQPTERQREVLAAIASYHKQHKIAPSREDVRQATGVKHLNSVVKHVQLLTAKGLVMQTPGVPRSLHLTKAGMDALKGGSNGST